MLSGRAESAEREGACGDAAGAGASAHALWRVLTQAVSSNIESSEAGTNPVETVVSPRALASELKEKVASDHEQHGEIRRWDYRLKVLGSCDAFINDFAHAGIDSLNVVLNLSQEQEAMGAEELQKAFADLLLVIHACDRYQGRLARFYRKVRNAAGYWRSHGDVLLTDTHDKKHKHTHGPTGTKNWRKDTGGHAARAVSLRGEASLWASEQLETQWPNTGEKTFIERTLFLWSYIFHLGPWQAAMQPNLRRFLMRTNALCDALEAALARQYAAGQRELNRARRTLDAKAAATRFSTEDTDLSRSCANFRAAREQFGRSSGAQFVAESLTDLTSSVIRSQLALPDALLIKEVRNDLHTWLREANDELHDLERWAEEAESVEQSTRVTRACEWISEKLSRFHAGFRTLRRCVWPTVKGLRSDRALVSAHEQSKVEKAVVEKIAQFTLETHHDRLSLDKLAQRVYIPGAISRNWIRVSVTATFGLVVLRLLLSPDSREYVIELAYNAVDAVGTFVYNQLVPLAKFYDAVVYSKLDFRGANHLIVEDAQKTLDNLVREYNSKHTDQIASSNINEALQIALEHPVKSMVNGNLVEVGRIEIQRARTEGARALLALDKLLRGSEVTFHIIALVPILLSAQYVVEVFRRWMWRDSVSTSAARDQIRALVHACEITVISLEAIMMQREREKEVRKLQNKEDRDRVRTEQLRHQLTAELHKVQAAHPDPKDDFDDGNDTPNVEIVEIVDETTQARAASNPRAERWTQNVRAGREHHRRLGTSGFQERMMAPPFAPAPKKSWNNDPVLVWLGRTLLYVRELRWYSLRLPPSSERDYLSADAAQLMNFERREAVLFRHTLTRMRQTYRWLAVPQS